MSVPAAVEKRVAALQEGALALAHSVFEELDPELEPQVGLIALPQVPGHGGVLLATGQRPESDRKDLADEVASRLAAVAGSGMEGGARPLAPDAGRKLLAEALERVSDPATLPFVSTARLLGDSFVYVALGLDRSVITRYPSLERRRAPTGQPLAVSLLQAAVFEFLSAAAAMVAEHADQDAGFLVRSPDEVIRSAGRLLMQTPALAAGNDAWAHGFFQTCHRISTMHYEGHEGSGRMIVAAAGHPNVSLELTFHTRIDLDDHRAVRKVLELTGRDLALVSDSAYLRGLGRTEGVYEDDFENLFEVSFQGHARWTLSHAGQVLMTVADGMPRLPRAVLEEGDLQRILREVFGKLAPTSLERLWVIVARAMRQRRGTLVVVMEHAAQEAARLGRQALRLDPVLLTPERVPLVTAIDGAILIDLDGVCHAVGVILDGKASRRGDPARGARFNSAVRYVDASERPCLAVVVSEEGGADLIRPLF